MDLQNLIRRVTDDSTFAADVKAAAKKAISAGQGTPEWSEYVALLGDDPEGVADNGDPQGIRWTTVTTLTSVECLTTTTTTGH